MTLLDDAGQPLTLDSLMAEDAPPGDQSFAETAPSPDGAGDPLAAAETPDAPDEERDEQEPTAPAIDWDDPSNPYLTRFREQQERLDQIDLERRQAEAHARRNMAQQIQQFRANRRLPLLQNLDQMNADQLRAALAREFQFSDAEFGEVASRDQQTQQQREWDEAVQRAVTDYQLTADETELIAGAANEAVLRQMAQKAVAARTQANARMSRLERQLAQVRSEQKIATQRATGTGPAQRVGGTAVGVAPGSTPTNLLSIMREELGGDPNRPIRIG